jgi:DNA polymerase/3'-5' exonuclease PolX
MANIAQNQDIARRLREVAQLLEDQGANRFRVRAYRAAAETIERLPVPAAEIAQQQGTDGLQSLPGIGVSLARSIHTLVVTGRLPMLDRLRGYMDPVSLLASIPGIGPALAHRLHDELHVETLEQLEMAAHDGRLADIEGIGPKKLQGIVDSLTARLGRVRKPPQGTGTHTIRERRKKPGFRYSIHSEAPAIIPPCSQTAPWPINSTKHATGSSSTTMMAMANASAP